VVGPKDIEAAMQAIDAWNRVDLDGFLVRWHPECEWRPAFPKGTEGSGTVFRGHEGVARAWRGVREAWDTYLLDITDHRVAGDDLVVLGEIHLRGKESEMELDSAWSAVVRFKDGKLISAWDWLEHSAALEAAGLS
jgi:ketosteroid isomerase-like protein